MHAIKLITATLCIIFITGCATTSSPIPESDLLIEEVKKQAPQPDWVKGQSKNYPHLGYISYQTSAESEIDAKALAIKQLSSLFSVNVEKHSMSTKQAEKAANYSVVQSLSNDEQHWVAATDAARIHDAIEVVDRWHDLSTGKHHAFAVLARNSVVGFLRQQIENLDSLTKTALNQAHDSTDLLAKTGLIAKAWRIQQIRAKLQSSMRSADVTGRGIKPLWDADQLKNDCLVNLTRLKIYPTGFDEDINAQSVTTILIGGLKLADLTASSKDDADYLLRAKLDVSIAGAEGRWALGHGVIKLVLADNASGKVRGSKTLEIETPGLDEIAARRRVLEKAEYLMKREMRNLLLDMAI